MRHTESRRLLRIAGLVVLGLALVRAVPTAQSGQRSGEMTFTKDVAPILQRSCQSCHRPRGVAPMPLTTYEEVRPYAAAIKQRTGLRDRRGVMPPWFIEKKIGIQHFKDDISPSEAGNATIATWVDHGTARRKPAR